MNMRAMNTAIHQWYSVAKKILLKERSTQR